MKPLRLPILGLMAGIIAAGCAATNKAIAPTKTQASISPGIQQVGYGLDARFTWCSGARCPVRTVKTLSQVEPPPIAAVIAPVPLPPQMQEIRKRFMVPFKSGSAQLGNQEAQAIDVQSADIERSRRIEIRGRTDDTGSLSRNATLARQRAEAVRDYLTQRRLNNTVEITLESKGSCCYAADNRSAAGRATNRRVEVEMFIVTP